MATWGGLNLLEGVRPRPIITVQSLGFAPVGDAPKSCMAKKGQT